MCYHDNLHKILRIKITSLSLRIPKLMQGYLVVYAGVSVFGYLTADVLLGINIPKSYVVVILYYLFQGSFVLSLLYQLPTYFL